MLKERLEAARQVVDSLTPAETTLDQAIARTAGLNQRLIESGLQVRAGLTVGQSALSAFGDAYNHLIKARECFTIGHAELKAVRSRLGLDAYAVGDSSECPDAAKVLVSTAADLRVVA